MTVKIMRFALTVAAGLTVSACMEGPLADLSRTADDPVIVSPSAVSLRAENRVDLSWDEDDGAEAYVLERAPDAPTLVYSVVYSGSELGFTDVDLIDQARYLYRLSKVRGSRSFGPSDSVMGIGSSATIDLYEPNDDEASATELVYDIIANMYYYRSYEGKVIQDTDWYFVTIPPRRKANIVVTQASLTGGATDTYFYFYEKGMVPVTVVNNDAIAISNTSYEAKRSYFKIYPKPDEFVNDLTLGGGTLVNYTVSLYSVTGL